MTAPFGGLAPAFFGVPKLDRNRAAGNSPCRIYIEHMKIFIQNISIHLLQDAQDHPGHKMPGPV